VSPEIRMICMGKPTRELIAEIEEKEPLKFLQNNFQTHPLRTPRVDKHKHLRDHRRGKEVRGA